MKKFVNTALALLLSIAASSQAEAYLYSWSATADVTEGVDANLAGGQDILAAWHATDADYHYFRMDLRSAPSLQEGGRPNYAGLYGIYIDKTAGGAVGSDPVQTYVPDSLAGIDNIVDSHFEPNLGGYFGHDFHTWNGVDAFTQTAPFAVSQNENGGTTLEWAVTIAALGTTEFTWWAVTHDIGAAAPTYDMIGPVTASTATSAVPLPAAFWLLGSGLLGLAGLHRRHQD